MNSGIFSGFGGRNTVLGKPDRITIYTSGTGTFRPLSPESSWARVTLVAGGNGGDGGRGSSQNGGAAGQTLTMFIKLSYSSYNYAVGAGGARGNGGEYVDGNLPAVGWSAGGVGGKTTFGTLTAEGSNSAWDSAGVRYSSAMDGDGGYGGLGAHPGGLAGGRVGASFYFSGNPRPGSSVGGGGDTYGLTDPYVYLAGGGGGGDSVYGRGGNGGAAVAYGNGNNAGPATGYGSGGGAGGNSGPEAPFKGGNGSAGRGGLIIIEEYIFK